MKKILFLSILLSFLFVSHTFAAYTFSASTTNGAITATLSGAAGSTSSFKLLVQTTQTFPSSPPSTGITTDAANLSGITIQKPNVQGVVTWNIPENANTTYYVRPVEIPQTAVVKSTYAASAATVTTGDIVIPFTALITKTDNNNIIVSGKIDPSKISFDATKFTATLIYTSTVPLTGATALTNIVGPLTSKKSPSLSGVQGINDDGTYYWYLTNLSPSTVYYFQQTLSVAGNKKPTVDVIDHVNSSVGTTIAPGSTAEQADLNQRQYTLLSKGFPGLSILPDPDLCAQERAAGQTPQFCDMNDVLNYALRLLIGLSGVMLVFRLMYEGYKYMTTDVPYISASAKSGFTTALLGLLLALTSYIILNTINPKLVSESINVQQLSIGIPETSLDTQTFQNITGEKLQTKSQYLPMVQSIAAQQGVDACVVEATIQAESSWNAGAIGCDEDQPYSNVPSRKAFLQSGVTYNGTTFTPTTNTSSSQTNGACKFDSSKPGYGLDWRFSKGGGLMQVTIFPSDYKTDAWYAGVKQGGRDWNNKTIPYTGWQNLIKPETNIAKGTQLLKQNLADCKGNVEQAFREYESGSCTGSSKLVDATVAKKMSVYNSCKTP